LGVYKGKIRSRESVYALSEFGKKGE